MASSYALPSTALPHAHRQYLHAHSHSHPQPSLHALRSSMAGGSGNSNSDLQDDAGLNVAASASASGSGLSSSHLAHARSRSHEKFDRPASSQATSHDHKHSSSCSHSHSSSSSPAHSQNQAVPRTKSAHMLHSKDKTTPAPLAISNGWQSESIHPETKLQTPSTPAFTQMLPSEKEVQHDHHGCSHQPFSHGLSGSLGGSAHTHAPGSTGGGHKHLHSPALPPVQVPVQASLVSRVLIQYAAGVPFLHSILVERDSRRIFYFLTLNFTFMGVQAFYAYATSSLGLLSDTVHMFFDCFALLVGLCAAVMSKWPPSERYPYGLGKVETLSGFANGILLMLLSVEIIGEAAERVMEGTPPKRLQELLTISVLGGLVNAVGLLGFGHHHHHGHDHGHGSCSGSHKKTDDHSHHHHHDHGHHDGHNHDHDHDHKHDHGHDHGQDHHAHSHHNENMEGIFLHVMADLMGSVAVVASTLLTMYTGWTWWDAVAGILVSVLIAMAAWPLLKSSARNLLLSIPERTEYSLRNTLAGIVQQRGVVSYGVPKFWIDDIASSAGEKLRGVVHVAAASGASLDDVRDRVRGHLLAHGMDIVVQVEREGDGGCWCGVGRTATSPALASPRVF